MRSLPTLLVPFFALVACAPTATPPADTARPLASSASSAAPIISASAAIPPPPFTRRDDVTEILHGVALVDPYRWLEDQESPETRAWIDAQNGYAHSLLDPLESRAPFRARLEALSRLDSQSLPRARKNRYFTWKRAKSDDLWSYYVRDGRDGTDEVLLDPHTLSADHTTSVTVYAGSNDGRRLAYGIRRGGEDETELRLFDVDARKDLPDRFPRALYRGAAMRPDGSGVFYTLQDRDKGPRIRHHATGTPTEKDVEVFGAGLGPSDNAWTTVSDDGRRILITVGHGWSNTDVYLQDLTTKNAPVVALVKGRDARSMATFAGTRVFVFTNLDAPKGRVVEIDPRHPEPERWRTVVPMRDDAIEDWEIVGGRIAVSYMHDVSARLVLVGFNGTVEGEIALPPFGSLAGVSGRWDSDEMFFSFTSYTAPWSAFRADVKTREVKTWWTPAVPFDAAAYETKQVWVTSKDGTRVPMFVVHKKGIPLDGARPTLLYGYGGFNISITPGFSSFAAAWMDAGGVYAVPNLRGGGEFGEAWHRAGMLDKKQNVFDDFIAAAEWLIANKYTSAEKLAISGGSNGGLLVGAALTQRPELFRAVLCAFPDLDMIGYYRFKNNNPPALLEYGNASKPEEFKFLIAYSPYQRVTKGTRYPAVMLTTGDQDTRVPPLQARKMTARLQSDSASGRPIVLLYDTKAGHAGGKPLGKALDDDSLELAFVAWQLGMDMAAPK